MAFGKKKYDPKLDLKTHQALIESADKTFTKSLGKKGKGSRIGNMASVHLFGTKHGDVTAGITTHVSTVNGKTKHIASAVFPGHEEFNKHVELGNDFNENLGKFAGLVEHVHSSVGNDAGLKNLGHYAANNVHPETPEGMAKMAMSSDWHDIGMKRRNMPTVSEGENHQGVGLVPADRNFGAPLSKKEAKNQIRGKAEKTQAPAPEKTQAPASGKPTAEPIKSGLKQEPQAPTFPEKNAAGEKYSYMNSTFRGDIGGKRQQQYDAHTQALSEHNNGTAFHDFTGNGFKSYGEAMSSGKYKSEEHFDTKNMKAGNDRKFAMEKGMGGAFSGETRGGEMRTHNGLPETGYGSLKRNAWNMGKASMAGVLQGMFN